MPLPEFDAILLCDELGFETIRNSGLWWRSPLPSIWLCMPKFVSLIVNL